MSTKNTSHSGRKPSTTKNKYSYALDEEQILENPHNYSLGIEVLKQRFCQPPQFGKTDRTTNNRRNKTREKCVYSETFQQIYKILALD